MTNSIRNIINTTAPAAPITAEQALEEKERIEEALIQIRQAKSWDEYTTVDDQAQIELLEAKLKASLTLINHFLTTGEWGVPTLGPDGTRTDLSNNVLRDLSPGWNGDMETRQNAFAGMGNLAGLVPDGEFEGFVYIKETGDPLNPPQLAFQASQETIKIEGFNHGSHIIYVETYRDADRNERKRWWVGVDHATNLNAQIAVTAHNVTDHGVHFDFHRVLRIGDGSHGVPSGTPGGITLIGSDNQDIIYGTQGDDTLTGLNGNDELYGEGGIDTISGDSSGLVGDQDAAQGVTVEHRRSELGLRNDIAGGDDTIDGGAGLDVISGDDGIDAVYEANADGENHVGTEHTIQNRIVVPQNGDWIDEGASPGWEVRRTGMPQGTVEVRPSSEVSDQNSELVLKMPEGYDYATAEGRPDGSIEITYVRHEEGLPPQSFTVIVRGALRNRNNNPLEPMTFRFSGNNGANIIDFSGLVLDGSLNNNNFIFEGMGDNDMVLAPKNALNQYGLEYEDLINSPNRYRGGELEGQIGQVIPDAEEENSGIHAVRNSAGDEIVISREWTDEENANTSLRSETRPVQIDPSDFDRVYIVREGTDLKIILVRQGIDGSDPETLVIRIDQYQRFLGDGDLRDMGWLSFGPTGETFSAGAEAGDDSSQGSGRWDGQIIYLTTETIGGRQVAGNIIQGGSGEDFAFYYEGDRTSGIESEIIAEYSSGTGDGEEI